MWWLGFYQGATASISNRSVRCLRGPPIGVKVVIQPPLLVSGVLPHPILPFSHACGISPAPWLPTHDRWRHSLPLMTLPPPRGFRCGYDKLYPGQYNPLRSRRVGAMIPGPASVRIAYGLDLKILSGLICEFMGVIDRNCLVITLLSSQ